ncbi:glutathione S-transferase family protein [Algiphilus sp. W345]|uniref:Glutathione S-transferase family protein n=1 Tax=Banduia mediterranea TaxID=3075609 RepID=A0ABU2WG91_9GAMM|nr:glutathione S-transferase family protein [Algiphilus sp. W345]MDT0496898.1 glutathione S-transferase family protein [Algiphilus sp. W345]
MYTVYGMSSSGNCHKLRLLLDHLGLPFHWQEVDITTGASRQPDFLALNANGRVPVLQLDNGETLAESNAILCFLAEDTRLWPGPRLARARTLQWLFFEQYSHEPYIAVARYICGFLPPDHERRAELPKLHERGRQALAVMEQYLSGRQFFVEDRFGIADIALYAYTHAAADGGFRLEPYPSIRAWLDRVAGQRGHTPMARPPRLS